MSMSYAWGAFEFVGTGGRADLGSGPASAGHGFYIAQRPPPPSSQPSLMGLVLTLIVGVTSFVALVGFATGGLACVIVGGPAITLAVWLVSRRRPQPGRCAHIMFNPLF